MSRTISTGIDIGTAYIKVVVAEHVRTERGPERRIIGIGSCESLGLRHGYIIDSTQVTRAVRQAVDQAERAAGVRIKSAVVSVSGVGLEGHTSTGTSVVSRADSEITELDIERATSAARQSLPDTAKLNRKIIHTIPLSFKLDGKEIMGRVLGMRGVKLENKTLFVSILEQHFADLVEAIEATNIEVRDVCAAPIATAVATLSKAQRIAGCVLADIGSETVSVIVYENDMPISLKVFEIGSNNITHDIALGLRIPIEEAESIKTGSAVSLSHSRKKLDEIINARLKDIFELIEAHLKKLGKNGLLPAGIILTGGGSRIPSIEDIAKNILGLPVRSGSITFDGSSGRSDPSWTTAYGLALLGLTPGVSSDTEFPSFGLIPFFKKIGSALGSSIKKLLP